MKNILFTILVFNLLTSFYVKNNEKNKLTITIDRVWEAHKIHDAESCITPKAGNKFIHVFITIKNNSEEISNIDFNMFQLLDENSNNFSELVYVMQTKKINIWTKHDLKLKAHQTKRKQLVYLMPEIKKPMYLKIHNSELIKIETPIKYIN